MNTMNNIKNKSIWDEKWNISLLVLLYAIQGVPLGLSLGSIPFLLQNVASYTDIGIFSFAVYPYSLKLLWSPVVDAVYLKSFGRRKSWIVPLQLLVGVVFMSFHDWINDFFQSPEPQSRENIIKLTIVFFLVVFLVATQDIAVDGWALSLLDRDNRALASTCQSIGLNIGFFASYTVFLGLHSAEFCNSWVRPLIGSSELSDGMVSLGGYMYFWGFVMVVSTLGIAVFKHEEREKEASSSVMMVYRDIWRIIQLPTMKSLMVLLLTARLGFAAVDNVTMLKLNEKGFPKEVAALSVLLTFPFEILFPIVIAHFGRRSPHKALGPYITAYPARIFLALVSVYMIATFPSLENITWMTYLQIISLQVFNSLAMNMMFVSQCAFFARIADESIGGTYMTLVNTIANFGSTWPKFFVLYLVDYATVKKCDDGHCEVLSDGFYAVSFACLSIAVCWFIWMRNRLLRLQSWDLKKWRYTEEVKSD